MIPIPPETQILERAKTILEGVAFHTIFGLPEPATIRHERHRKASKSEIPGIALRLVSTEIDNERGPYHTSSEVCWALTFEIVVDLELLAEKSDKSLPAGDDNDVTGWDRLLGVGRYAAGQLVKRESAMRGLVDDLLYGDIDPDEDTQPDKGRLAASVIVLYRTLFDDPMRLLGPEQNG